MHYILAAHLAQSSLPHVGHVLDQGAAISTYHYHTHHMGTLLIRPNHSAHLMSLMDRRKLAQVHRVPYEGTLVQGYFQNLIRNIYTYITVHQKYMYKYVANLWNRG